MIITPHNEAIRYEYARGFGEWYRLKTGRTVSIDWRMVGGTSDIARFLEGEYTTAFENHWRRTLGRPWSAEVQNGFQRARLPAEASAAAREARAAFLASDVGCGIDVFFGGGTYDLERQARAGRLVDSGVMQLHPDWFTEKTIPRHFGGEDYWHPDGLWIGTVLSSYGILYNRDALKRLGFEREPTRWDDLADPRLIGEVGLADPTKSGSVASVDPIGLLRGARHRTVACAFIEYTLSMEGQKLWNFKPGAPGGPQRFVLRRMPVRRDFYAQPAWQVWRSDPEESPFEQDDPLIYREAWTGKIFREMAFVIRVMCQDTHEELRTAWRAIIVAPEPAKSRALAVLQDISAVNYERTTTGIHARLSSKDKVDEVRVARELADVFRANYARAEAIATGRAGALR